MPWWVVLLCTLNVMKYLRVSLAWSFFASVISSGTSPTFLSQPLSSFIDMLASTKFLRPNIWSPSNSTGINIPVLAISLVAPCAFDANFTSWVTCFFVECFSLLADSLLWLLIRMKCHMGLSLGHKEKTQPHVLLSLCGQHTNAQGPVLDSEKGT